TGRRQAQLEEYDRLSYRKTTGSATGRRQAQLQEDDRLSYRKTAGSATGIRQAQLQEYDRLSYRKTAGSATELFKNHTVLKIAKAHAMFTDYRPMISMVVYLKFLS
ncbi:MAG: hypothetical protein KAZ27_07360, partial [Saprospiraceae bacterium]|nr:hypothetical protein [Saprospiraceae bacterium]